MKGKVFWAVLFLALLAVLPAVADTPIASIMFTNNAQTQYYWGTNTRIATGVTAEVTGEGMYTVSVTFKKPIEDIYFSQLSIQDAEFMWPNSTIQIMSVRIDDRKTDFKKGFTFTADGKNTTISLWDPWFAGFNYDYNPRSYDGNLTEAFVLDKSDFIGAKSIEIMFYFNPGTESEEPLALLAFTNKAEDQAYWGYDTNVSSGVTAEITGEGLYTVSTSFVSPIKDIFFSEIIIKNAEQRWPNGTIQLISVKIDGQKVNYAKGFTFSNDKVNTIMTLWATWSGGVNNYRKYNPRSFDGNIKGTSFALKKTDFIGARNIEVTFYYSTGE